MYGVTLFYTGDALLRFNPEALVLKCLYCTHSCYNSKTKTLLGIFFLCGVDGLANMSSMNIAEMLDRYKDFYAGESVVLGLDIGIEGIGITVRRGKEWLYSKTLLVDLPEAKALAERRQFRASRHARKNRRVRMRRLAALFEKHGLPWVSDDVYSRSDPYMLRHRALKGKLAS